MDPIESINYKKDSTLAMLLEAQTRGYSLYYCQTTDLSIQNEQAFAHLQSLRVKQDPKNYYKLKDSAPLTPLAEMDIILMRKDPPFDMNYIYSTYILQIAEQQGALVVNRPESLRNANEKLYSLNFPDCIPPSIVTSKAVQIKSFLQEHEDIILKPLDGMGGRSIFRVTQQDKNINVIIETITENGQVPVMVQKFIPEISKGDKRILIIDGEPIPYALARMPSADENRANLAAGGSGVGMELSKRELQICASVKQRLLDDGLMFVGLDVIGDYLTEVNVTSPTCIRELDQQYNINISAKLFDAIERHQNKK